MSEKLRSFIYTFRNIFLIALGLFLVGKCQDKATNGHKNVTRITLEEVWTRMGDSEGKPNKEMDDAAVESAEFSSDSKYIVSGARKGFNVRVWNTQSGKLVFDHQCDNEIEAVAFSPDNEYILAGGEFNKLLIWKVADWSLVHSLSFNASVEGLRFSHDNKILAVGDESGKITIINVKSFKKQDSITHSSEDSSKLRNRADVNSLDFTMDDRYLISGGIDGKIKIWYVKDLKLIKTINAHQGSIKSVRVNHNDDYIATASSQTFWGNDNSIKIWDFKSGELLHSLSFPYAMEAVEFSPNGNILISGGREVKSHDSHKTTQEHIYIYYIPDNYMTEPIRQVHKEVVFRSEYLNFNSTGSHLVSSHEDGTVRLWKVLYH